MNDLPYLGYSLYEMYMIFCFWSVVGWIIEVIDMRIETGHFQNRGFLHIPFCPIYGFGMLLMNICLRNISDTYIPLFFASMILCTAFELLVGEGLEKLFNARWWDYSHMKFNYNGIICLRNALLFGFGSIVVLRVIEPAVERGLKIIPTDMGRRLLLLFSLIIAYDTAHSLYRAIRIRLSNANNGDEPILLFQSHK